MSLSDGTISPGVLQLEVPAPLQPLLNNETVVLRAPTQAWSASDGSMRHGSFHGVFFSDVRLVSAMSITIGGHAGEHIATSSRGVDSASFTAVLRTLDATGPDPDVRSEHTRVAGIDGVTERLTVRSRLATPIDTTVSIRLTLDGSVMDHLKAGLAPVAPPTIAVDGDRVSWGTDAVHATVVAPGATISTADAGVVSLTWPLTVGARSSASVGFSLEASDDLAVVAGVSSAVPWNLPAVTSADDRLARWLDTAIGDLDGLRLSRSSDPSRVFLAAGAPWFFTLFGRDSIWAARMMLPLGTRLAGDTLAILAALQGQTSVAATAEQPGKIMHELRRAALEIPSEGVVLPPLYYGTVDATALWICLLHDAWKWGLPDNEVRTLLPNVIAALEWMRDYGDSDGDGLLEYVDETGTGLSNQGWKDSGDSVQWRDGSLAEGPIALCEVQAYAFEAATHGADLLDHFGEPGGGEWRAWAQRLKTRFDETFWIADPTPDDPHRAYPAIALDAAKRPVDTVTSNLGHLLGTGLLDSPQSALIAARLVSPELSSGYGLRTMSTDSAGYWPLSYHGGSVWAHDTAIAITGLAKEGFMAEAGILIDGLLAAASGFHYRLPELHSGDSSADFASPVPYPAACRPQAWSAAASVAVLGAVLGLEADAPADVIGVRTGSSALFPLRVSGLQFRGQPFGLSLDADGEVTAAHGAPLEVR